MRFRSEDMDLALQAVCAVYGIQRHELVSKSRAAPLPSARYVAFRVLDSLGYSQADICREFGVTRWSVAYGLEQCDRARAAAILRTGLKLRRKECEAITECMARVDALA